MKRALVIPAAIALLCLSSLAWATITIQTVPVGDMGGGSVGYYYKIGTYEVTAGQYAAFLNAVAAIDTYGLYNAAMWTDSWGCHIQQSGGSGSYTYSVASDWANRPVNYVSFWDAIRFANWLHNGQPAGAQSLSTTEDGAYLINGYNGSDGATIVRKSGWKWALASGTEWRKAAYYKGGGTNAGYWDYPTKSNTAPGRDMADVSGNNANYYGIPHPIDNGKYTTVVGEFQNSPSQYGTFDQGGNLSEWNDAIKHQGYHYTHRVVRGGSFASSVDALRWDQIDGRDWFPMDKSQLVGFRVAAVPEPSSLLALAGGLGLILGLRRRKA